ncbi:FKBP-type peptidyl-prolyl cis-trans isomerase [Aquimarina sp. AU58]|uniref:FKBP-type peptidyl-prolyl cis-trans isomerase n=1 Tax=Aquimarina sp. AU58 TaxID=1874112 RepID=UPI001F16D223|nr:FKBP-type peptidyl-prolyl cis-trans isomerase [Aquimarina sp. AU58]
MMKNALVIASFLIFIFSCKSDDDGSILEPDPINLEYTQEEKDAEIAWIKSFIEENGIPAIETESGLHYVIEQEGNGLTPAEEDLIVFYYKTINPATGEVLGELTRDDSKYGLVGSMYGMLEGVREGFMLVNEGTIITMIVPSYLAYGKRGSFIGDIEPETILMYTMELNLVLKK